jgi:hypothetical protein
VDKVDWVLENDKRSVDCKYQTEINEKKNRPDKADKESRLEID